VLCVDPEKVKPLLETATSFSCALGKGIETLPPLLTLLPDKAENEARPRLFACENDHASVETVQRILRSKVEAVPCMVDRICSDLELNGHSISVTAEEHTGSIVVMQQQDGENEPLDEDFLPLGGDGVQLPEKEAHARYLYRKKLLTVNGMHTVIAFISLREYARKQGPDFEVPDEPVNIPLISADTLTEATRQEIWQWAVAQLLVLMWEHGVPTMMKVHEVDDEAALVAELLEHERVTLQRFFDVEDSTARVLGGGVSARYKGRLVPVSETVSMDVFNESFGPAQNVLLKEANVSFSALKETLAMLVEDARPFAAVDQRVRAEKALEEAKAKELAALAAARDAAKLQTAANISILFDFDGTLGDTETPAMEVAFWEIAPYLPDAAEPEALSNQRMKAYIRENAGKAFEFMLESLGTARAERSLPPVETVRRQGSEDPSVLSIVNKNRLALGLPTLEKTRGANKTLLELQKEETVESLSILARPCEGVVKTLNSLRDLGFRFAISTTSPKPRVPVCVDKSGLREWFGPEKIHSGESDFNPPRFKPDPAVYLKAAAAEETDPSRCIAVEDSTSGVGSAANAGIGLIVGYVGASHISRERKHQHALSLLSGARSEEGRGADVVLSDLEDLTHVANYVNNRSLSDGDGFAHPFSVEPELAAQMQGRYWFVHSAQGSAQGDS
jgi:beta-phosphoglucomutase-like phosphatase (HAD superfamily)